MLERFDPKVNKNDHRILFEILGRKLDGEADDQFDSGEDDEENYYGKP